VFYYLHEKYDNFISIDPSRFKRSLHKIEGIEFFPSYFFELTLEFLGLDNKRDTNFVMLRTKIVLRMRHGCLLHMDNNR
jgi:hypothetical protein